MKYYRYLGLSVFMLGMASVQTKADDYGSNIVYVKSSPNGQCYAKALPAERYGSKGVTKVFVVREGEDQLVETYSWYASRIDLQVTAWGISVVRIGSWRRGQKPSASDLAIGFYLAGKTLKEHSTLDVAHDGNGSDHVFQYFGIVKVSGYRWIRSNDYAFDVETGGGKTLSFDIRSGMLSSPPNKRLQPPR